MFINLQTCFVETAETLRRIYSAETNAWQLANRHSYYYLNMLNALLLVYVSKSFDRIQHILYQYFMKTVYHLMSASKAHRGIEASLTMSIFITRV